MGEGGGVGGDCGGIIGDPDSTGRGNRLCERDRRREDCGDRLALMENGAADRPHSGRRRPRLGSCSTLKSRKRKPAESLEWACLRAECKSPLLLGEGVGLSIHSTGEFSGCRRK